MSRDDTENPIPGARRRSHSQQMRDESQNDRRIHKVGDEKVLASGATATIVEVTLVHAEGIIPPMSAVIKKRFLCDPEGGRIDPLKMPSGEEERAIIMAAEKATSDLADREIAFFRELTDQKSSREAGVAKYLGRYKTHLMLSKCDATLTLVIENIRRIYIEDPSRSGDIDYFFLELLLSIERGLRNFDRRRIIHGDINPNNILVKRDPDTGELYCVFADLGSALRHDELAAVRNKVSGTPGHMAPEVCDAWANLENSPLPPFRLPAAVDLYSVGAVLSEVISPQEQFFLSLPAFLAAQGLKYDKARAEQKPFLDQREILDGLLKLSPKKCVEKLIEYLCETLPENRPTFDTFSAVIRYLERSMPPLPPEKKTDLLVLYQELISPVGVKKSNSPWAAFFSECSDDTELRRNAAFAAKPSQNNGTGAAAAASP